VLSVPARVRYQSVLALAACLNAVTIRRSHWVTWPWRHVGISDTRFIPGFSYAVVAQLISRVRTLLRRSYRGLMLATTLHRHVLPFRKLGAPNGPRCGWKRRCDYSFEENCASKQPLIAPTLVLVIFWCWALIVLAVWQQRGEAAGYLVSFGAMIVAWKPGAMSIAAAGHGLFTPPSSAWLLWICFGASVVCGLIASCRWQVVLSLKHSSALRCPRCYACDIEVK